MSLFGRSSSSASCSSVIVTSFVIAACVDAPRLSPSERSTSDGGGSGAARERDGMILVPEVILDPSAVTPPGVDLLSHGDDKDDDRGTGDKGDKGAHGSTGGGVGGRDSGRSDGGEAESGTLPAPPQVVVPSFWIDSGEVTVASYRRCVASGTCVAPDSAPGCTLSEGLEAHPVTCVTLDQSHVFCTWNHKRLVRDDEHSAASSGTDRRPFPWGAAPPAADRINACGTECTGAGMYAASDGFPRSAPTASFSNGRTPEGAFDLAGNVAEWVEGGLVPLARGGSYEDVDPSSVSATAVRSRAAAGPSVGFRCAADTAAR